MKPRIGEILVNVRVIGEVMVNSQNPNMAFNVIKN